jgi:hypothetical protein
MNTSKGRAGVVETTILQHIKDKHTTMMLIMLVQEIKHDNVKRRIKYNCWHNK